MKFDFRFLLIDNLVTTLVSYSCSVVRLAFCETHFQLESFISGDFLPSSPSHVQPPRFSLRGPGLTLTSRTMSLEVTHLESTLMKNIGGLLWLIRISTLRSTGLKRALAWVEGRANLLGPSRHDSP